MRLTGWNRILAPTDLSPCAEKAVHYAHRLAETLGSELHVLHVVHDAGELSAFVPATGIVDPENLSDDYHRWLAKLLGERGTVRRVEAVRIGKDVAETIRQYAEKQEVDLVVMATHGHTGLMHLLLGGVAEKMLRVSPCPVLVIRPCSGPTTRETGQSITGLPRTGQVANASPPLAATTRDRNC